MRHLSIIVGLLIMAGFLFRLWPTIAGMPALANFFITEDGYLMLTVSRNMAIGNGMSVSDGTIATNGVQPLIAFVFAVPYLLTEGDKVSSLIAVHLIHAMLALVAVFAIRALAARLMTPRDDATHWPWVAALMWFLGPLLLRHSMNGLETGLYTLTIVVALLLFARMIEADSLQRRLGFGAFCGLVVLARNDGVFFVASAFLVWASIELFVNRLSIVAMCARLTPPGLLSIAVAAPWLINNAVRFGSIVPVSGTAQSQGAELGQNIPLLPVTLFEHLFPMLPIPGGFERTPWLMGIAILCIAVTLSLFLWRQFKHGTPVARALSMIYLVYGVSLVGYYGLFFGAPHFLGRYTAPLAPLLIIAALVAALELGRLINRKDLLAWCYGGLGLVLICLLLVRMALPGMTRQGHEQVVAWIQENVPPTVWVGAVQTGTLGYWHDRTYNLDGKVNPEALAAIRTNGHVLDYVVDSPIAYIADWAGVGRWISLDAAQNGFAETFELLVQDDAANLAVMKRRD
jgi:hypothetical protein